MDRSTKTHSNRLATLIPLLALLGSLQAYSQVPVDADGTPVSPLDSADEKYAEAAYESEYPPLTAAELETLVGPIALYPDDLLAIVLPASTYPLQIVQAARFMEAFANDSSLKPDEDWDESVIALINYPEVVQLLNDDIDWTWRLGEAVISQQQDIVVAVETFRDRAYVAGNLKSDDYQTVSVEDNIIEIVPIEDDIIYVPYYEPERVVVRQPEPVYHYYRQAYPVYYYPYPVNHAFSSGYFWGVTTAFRIGWATDHLHVRHASYWGHPYYGHHYYGHYYRQPSISVYKSVYINNARHHTAHRYRDGDYWRPHRRAGARQSDRRVHARHYRNDVQSVRNSSYRTDARRSNSGATANTTRSSYTAVNRENRRQPVATTTSRRPEQRQVRSDDARRTTQTTRTRDSERSAPSRSNREQRPQRTAQNTPVRQAEQQRAPRQVARNDTSRPSQQQRPTRSEPRQSQARSTPRPDSGSSQQSPRPQKTEKSERSTNRASSDRNSSRKDRRSR